MIRGRYLQSGDDTSAVFDLRTRVFVREQGFSPDTDVDAYDNMSIYALVFDDDDRPVGTGRLFIDADDRFTIGRVCVLPEARNKGFGDLIVRMLLARALDLNAPSVTLSAQADKAGFYRRYGFRACGPDYPDEGVAHTPMRALRDEVNLEGACKAAANPDA
jgi:predicted GNAT family N-acyltransferase